MITPMHLEKKSSHSGCTENGLVLSQWMQVDQLKVIATVQETIPTQTRVVMVEMKRTS